MVATNRTQEDIFMSNQNITTESGATAKDGYDRNLIPAETAARIEREGDQYKKTPTASEEDGLDTTSGYTTSREGLINNYAVEPEMYYEERGDLREKEEAIAAQRAETLKEINQTDEAGKLGVADDQRGKGAGII